MIAKLHVALAVSACAASALICGLEGRCGAGEECAPLSSPTGVYVEGRTASVYAGACHYGGEYTTAGREAVLAWRIDAGGWDGVDLAGTSIVCVVSADENLAEGGARASRVYVSEGADVDAARAWLVANHGAVLGELGALEVAPIRFEREGDAFAVAAGDAVELVGTNMPDRECCKMPFNVWYDPLVDVEEPLVGCAERFACVEPDLDLDWVRAGENCAFTATF